MTATIRYPAGHSADDWGVILSSVNSFQIIKRGVWPVGNDEGMFPFPQRGFRPAR